jgi:DHA3 family macrolide efflux protein-like MFS transporter
MSLLEDEISSIPPASPTAPPDAPPPKINFFTVLKHSGFRNLWLGQIVSQIGDYFAFLALTVVVSGFSSDLQQTTLQVTGLMISFTLPRLLFGLLAGVFVDRWDRRRTMLVSDILRAGITLLMIPAFLASNLFAIYALAFVMSTVATLFNPAKGALIPNLVPTEQLLAANSLSQTSQTLAILIGPALAGFTLKTAGTGNEWVAFIVDSVSFAVSALAIWLIRIPEHLSQPQPTDQPDKSAIRNPQSAIGRVWQELLVGLKALFLNRTMATLTAIFTITMLGIGAINVLWVIYLKTRFGFDGTELAWRFGLTDVAFAVGMILASVAAGNFLARLAPKWFIVFSLIGIGIGLAVFVLISDYWVFLVANVLLGVFVAPIETGVGTLMQIVVPNNQLGRVGGGFATVSDSATIVSMGAAGAVGSLLGIPMVFVIAGVLCTIMGFAAWALLPNVTLKDKPDDITSSPSLEGPAPLGLREAEPAG